MHGECVVRKGREETECTVSRVRDNCMVLGLLFCMRRRAAAGREGFKKVV